MSAAESFLSDREVIVDFLSEDIFSQVLNFMYAAEIKIEKENVRPLLLAAARLEMQGLVNAIMSVVLKWEQLPATETRDARTHSRSKPPHRACKKVEEEHRRRRKRNDFGANDQHAAGGCFGDFQSECTSDEDDSTFLNIGDKHPAPSDEKITVTGIMDELRLQGDLKMLELVRNFAARNFGQVSRLDSFLEATVHTVACLLDDERLNVSEFKVFSALCRWLEADPLHLVHAPYLLSNLRLQLLSPQELADHVETKDYLMGKKKCRVLILEAFRFHCLRAQSGEDSTSRRKPRDQQPRKGATNFLVVNDYPLLILAPSSGVRTTDYDSDENDLKVDENQVFVKKNPKSPFCPVKPCACCPDYILLSGGIDVKEKSPSDGVYKYEERENTWLRFAKIPQARNHHAVVYCKGALYVLGGSDPSMTGPGAEVCPVGNCYKLSLGSLKWTRIASMSTPRMSLQAVHLNEYIYAIGGQDHKQRMLRDVERYSLERGAWEGTGSLSSARAGIAACAFDGRIWALGGYCHKQGQVLDIVETFQEKFGSWESAIPLRFPRCFANAAVCRTRLHIIGGAWLDSEFDCSVFSSVYDVDVYNDVSKVWEGITALRIGRHDAGVAVLGPRIYVVGGKNCDNGSIKNLDTVECFDVEKGDWLEGVSSLPLPLLGPAVSFTC